MKGNEVRKETRQIRDTSVKVVTKTSFYKVDIYLETLGYMS